MDSLQGVFKDKRVVLVSVVILIIGLTLGYMLGVKYPKSLQNLNLSESAQQTPVYKTNPLFQTQFAQITGKITKVDGRKITVVVGPDNKTDTFTFKEGAYIVNATGPKKVATPSSDIKDIQLDKEALIFLQFENNDFQIYSIAYKNFPDSSPSIKNAIRF